MVSMALHQVVRALTPFFTVVLTFVVYRTRYRRDLLCAIGVIFLGVFIYASKVACH